MEVFSTPDKTPLRPILREISANEMVNKSPTSSTTSKGTANRIAFDSDLSDADQSPAISKDDDLSASLIGNFGGLGLKTPIRSSADQTVTNLAFNFDGLGLVTPIRSTAHQTVTNSADSLSIETPLHQRTLIDYPAAEAANSPSSDDELFEECENSFNVSIPSGGKIVAESGYRSTNFSGNLSDSMSHSNIAHSTAETGLSTSNGHNSALNYISSANTVVEMQSPESTSPNKSDVQTEPVNKTFDGNATIQLTDENDTIQQTAKSSDELLYETQAPESLNQTVEVALKQIVVTAAISNETCVEQVSSDLAAESKDNTVEQKDNDLLNVTVENGSNNIAEAEDVLANESFEPMDVNMNETIDIVATSQNIDNAENIQLDIPSETVQESVLNVTNDVVEIPNQPNIDGNRTESLLNQTIEMVAENEQQTSNQIESLLNQTIEMADEDEQHTSIEASVIPSTVAIANTTDERLALETTTVLNTNVPVVEENSQPNTQLNVTMDAPSGIMDDKNDANRTFDDKEVATVLNQTTTTQHDSIMPATDVIQQNANMTVIVDGSVPIADDDSNKMNQTFNPNEATIVLSETSTQSDVTFQKLEPAPQNVNLNVTMHGASSMVEESNIIDETFINNETQILSSQTIVHSEPNFNGKDMAVRIMDETINIHPSSFDDKETKNILNQTTTQSESIAQKLEFVPQIADLNVTVDVVGPSLNKMNETFDGKAVKNILNQTTVQSVMVQPPETIFSGDDQLTGKSQQATANTNVTMPLESDSLFKVPQLDTRDRLSDEQQGKFSNLNETVVVAKSIPSVDVTFIADAQPNSASFASKTSDLFFDFDMKNLQQENVEEVEKVNETFKIPVAPAKLKGSFADLQNDFAVSDDEFKSSFVLNSNDFDFLLTKGNSPGNYLCRDSILEKFDPITGRKSIITAPLPSSSKSASSTNDSLQSIPNTSLFTTIEEADCSITEATNANGFADLISVPQPSKPLNTTVVVATPKHVEPIARLDTTQILTLDSHNSSGGDNSQASSTTETYETASIGGAEPLKTDATMSTGLIELSMDNMKLVDQDIKQQTNLKMNDESKVKEEIASEIDRKLKEAEAREESLLRRITEKEKALNKMSAVVENYEKTMVEMISEREQITQNYEKQIMQLKSERDSNFHHLTSLETTFSDLHVKYEKSKQLALEVKDNEAKLVEKLEFCQQQMKLQEQRYDKLKNHALTQLEGANSKLEALNKSHTNEIKKLSAQLKKEEISRQSIMEQLAQKTKENEELVKICDELINNGADGS